MSAGLRRGWLLLLTAGLMLMAGCREVAFAQMPGQTVPMATTTVQDTVYRADGTPASGTVLVSWSAFTTAAGQAVAAGSTSATIAANGVLTLQLAPNAGSTPMGSYYTAVLHLNDGTTSRQYWVVPVQPAGAGPARLAAIGNQVLPASVAMQTVSKQYVDTAIAAAVTGQPLATSSIYVLKAGDSMTGPLVLPADPASPNQAADKNYVDENIAAIAGGLGQKVSLLPGGTQLVAQPGGTQLSVNLLNGQVYAAQYTSGAGNNAIANALASQDCTGGCALNVEPTNPTTEPQPQPAGMARNTQVSDLRGGAQVRTVLDPLPYAQTLSTAEILNVTNTLSVPQLELLRAGAPSFGATALSLTSNALTGGSNLFPGNIEAVPYFKSTYGVLALHGNYNTQGQHIQLANEINCYGVGDCLAGGQFISSSGGYRDNADEGAHPYDLQITEDTRVFTGACSAGCATGATTLSIGSIANAGTQGDGRFLIDTNPARVLSAGSILNGGNSTLFGEATFSGTSFAASTFLASAQAATSQPTNMAPGTVTLAIATSNVAPGFATSTLALPATSGVACIADPDNLSGLEPNFETAAYTVVDSTHLQLTLNKPHLAGTVIAVGGLCGYGIEQKADTRNGIRQVFPVVGSINATALYYADAGEFLVGDHGAGSTTGFLTEASPIAAIVRTGGTVTVTTSVNLNDLTGLTLTIAGVADSSFNGSFPVTSTAANQFTYANAGSNSTSSGGTAAFLNGGYALYPMAEVLSVYNPASKLVDGTFTLAANTVAWAAGDPVEQPHFYKALTAADTEIITQYMPRPIQYNSAGKIYSGLVGAGTRGWQISNSTASNLYLGAGGTYTLPDDAYTVTGPWSNDFEVEAGTGAVVRAHCNLYGCNRWDSGYRLFDLDSASGEDTLTYQPQNSNVIWTLEGTPYSFTPAAFNAGTINVGTLNATNITSGVTAAAITSGTISPARLPLFGPSGSAHAPGAVPDPGATAGTARYLREDGSWSVPAGSGGGSGGGSSNGAAGGDLTGSYPNPTVSSVHATSGTLSGVTITGSGLVSGCAQLPCVVAAKTLTGLTATVQATSYYTPPATGTFRITVFPVITTAASATGTTVTPLAYVPYNAAGAFFSSNLGCTSPADATQAGPSCAITGQPSSVTSVVQAGHAISYAALINGNSAVTYSLQLVIEQLQ